MSGKMTRMIELTVLFSGQGNDRIPYALTLKRPPLGARITVRVDPESLITRSAFLLNRTGTNLVLTASVRQEQAEQARRSMGRSSECYRVVKVEILDDSSVDFEQNFEQEFGPECDPRRARAARRIFESRSLAASSAGPAAAANSKPKTPVNA